MANHLLSIPGAMVLISEKWRLSPGLTCRGLSPPFVHQWGADRGFPQSLTQEGIGRPLKPGKEHKGSSVNPLLIFSGCYRICILEGLLRAAGSWNGALRLVLKLPFRANTMPLFRCNVYVDQLKKQVKKNGGDSLNHLPRPPPHTYSMPLLLTLLTVGMGIEGSEEKKGQCS